MLTCHSAFHGSFGEHAVFQQYTVAEVLKVVREHGRETDVDLVSGGLTEIAFSEQELEEAKADYAAAQAAGIDVSRVQWMSKEEIRATAVVHKQFVSERDSTVQIITHD